MIEKMKFDMGGAGVLGAARCIGGLAPPGVEVHFIIAACENMVSAEAMAGRHPHRLELEDDRGAQHRRRRPSHPRRRSGVRRPPRRRRRDRRHRDADGRVHRALGLDYAAMYTDDEELKENLMTGGELLWRMPLAPEYAKQIKSPIADLANLGAPGGGGSITAALFLKEFIHDVSKDAQWAHLDIAGPVWNDKKGGATGFGVRTLVGLVESMAA